MIAGDKLGGGTMRTVTSEHSYDAPIEAVFEWLAEPSNYVTAPGMFSGRITRPGRQEPLGLGALRQFSSALSWWREEVTVFDRPRHFGYQVLRAIPPFPHHGATMELVEHEGGTHVAWASTFSMPVPVLGGLLERLLAPIGHFYIRTVLEAAAKHIRA